MHDVLHDFAHSLRKNDGVGAGMKKTTCKACSASLVPHVKEYNRSLFCREALPHLCDCLRILRLLSLRSCGLKSIPKEIEKLIHLRWLDLGYNEFSMEDQKTIYKLYNLQFLWLDDCEFEEIMWDIGNLIHLKHLDLSKNRRLKKLPERLCDLSELESLNVDYCEILSELPQGIDRLINLKHLTNNDTPSLRQFPQGIARLTSLRTLAELYGGNSSKLGWSKNLNQLSGSLVLRIQLTDDPEEVAEDAREAELRKKMHIQELLIQFYGNNMQSPSGYEGIEESMLVALEPHQNLQKLVISNSSISRLPGWIESINQLRSITLWGCEFLSSLPPMSKLPFLENIKISNIYSLKFVGREFLGMATSTITGDMDIQASSSSSSYSSMGAAATNTISFPKLKELTFFSCGNWKEWEDITAEEEDSAVTSLLPCLRKLSIKYCHSLTALPDRPLHKVSTSLEELNMNGSTELERLYKDKEGEARKSLYHHNPHLQLYIFGI